MSRPLRIEYPGAWYHVMNRGRRREKIFHSDTDRDTFISTLKEASDLWGLRVAAYCLMPNHYHLLVQTPDGNLSRCMRHLNGVYSQRFNRKHDTDGQLFRGRYKAVLVADDGYLLEVMRYIHRNPLRANWTNSLGDFQWSSHNGYLSRANKWSWLEKEPLLSMLSSSKNKQKSAYINFISMDEPEEIETFYSLKNLPSILGGDSFKETLRELFEDLSNPEIPELKILLPKPAIIITAVCDYYEISLSELLTSRRGVVNLPRDLAIYLVRNMCQMTLLEVGKEFDINNYSTVSSVVQRFKEKKQTERQTRQDFKRIVKDIGLSQKPT